MTREEFIQMILPAAMEGYKKYKILPSLTLAQAALESAWGKSHIQHNLFGIKTSSEGKVVSGHRVYKRASKGRALFRAMTALPKREDQAASGRTAKVYKKGQQLQGSLPCGSGGGVCHRSAVCCQAY